MNSLLDREKEQTDSDKVKNGVAQDNNKNEYNKSEKSDVILDDARQRHEFYQQIFVEGKDAFAEEADQASVAPKTESGTLYGDREKKYATIEEYRMLESQITVEQAESKEREQQDAAREALFGANSVSAAKDAAMSKELNSSAYAEAVRRKEAETASTQAAVQEKKLQEEQAAKAQAAAKEAAKAAKYSAQAMQKANVALADSAEREYYTNLAKKYLAGFAVAFLVLMTVIAINSAVLNGMDVELTALQQTLQEVAGRVTDLQNAIAQERSWDSILEFIERTGMVFVGF